MDDKRNPCDSIQAAITKVNRLLQSAKIGGQNILRIDVGGNLNPGDVYDAYFAIRRQPVVQDILEEKRCGPFAAVFLHRLPEENPLLWQEYVKRTFDSRYADGFRDGFQLVVPEHFDAENEHYLRGVYEGVMAHAAVF